MWREQNDVILFSQPWENFSLLAEYVAAFTFTFRAFGRCVYPKRLTKSTFVEGETAIYHCGT